MVKFIKENFESTEDTEQASMSNEVSNFVDTIIQGAKDRKNAMSLNIELTDKMNNIHAIYLRLSMICCISLIIVPALFIAIKAEVLSYRAGFFTLALMLIFMFSAFNIYENV